MSNKLDLTIIKKIRRRDRSPSRITFAKFSRKKLSSEETELISRSRSRETSISAKPEHKKEKVKEKSSSSFKLSDKIQKILDRWSKEDAERLFREDCPNDPYIPDVFPSDAAERIIVLGDIHGDWDLLIRSLKLGKLINDKLEWIAKPKTFLIQVGDQTDRCRENVYNCDRKEATSPDEASDSKILKFMNELGEKALKKGGRVINLNGNHEMMNVVGKFKNVSYLGLHEFDNYKDPLTNKEFKNGKEARKYAFNTGNEFGKLLGCTRNSVVIVGSFMFVHAGIMPELLEKFNIKERDDIGKINFLIRRWLVGYKDLQGKDMEKFVHNMNLSPFWPRIYGHIPPNQDLEHEDCDKYLKPILKTFNLNGLIVGHTPQFNSEDPGINKTCSGKLYRTDVGASKAFKSFDSIIETITSLSPDKLRKAQVLEIRNDKDVKILREK